MKGYRSAKKRIPVSVGESVRIVREFQELSQNQLAQLTGIPQATISAIENDRVRLAGGNTVTQSVTPGAYTAQPWGRTDHKSCTRAMMSGFRFRVGSLKAYARRRSVAPVARD